MGTEERICGICLKGMCDNFKVIEKDMKDVLHMVVPKIDLITAIQEPVMCTNCTEMITKCFNFKAVCLRTHDYIVPFGNKDSEKLDLKDVYLRANENKTGVSEDQDVCGLCMNPVKNCVATSLDVGDKDLLFAKMIKQCLPELDLSIIKEPVICPSCHGSLEHYFRFVRTYFLPEDKIEEYLDNLEINSKGQIKPNSVLQCTVKDAIKCEVDDDTVNEIKKEEQFCGETENADEIRIGNVDDAFKLEQMFYGEGKVEMKEQEFLVKEEIEIKTEDQDFNSIQDAPTSSQSITVDVNMYNPKDHMVMHQEANIYRCASCPLVTKYKSSLRAHVLIHRKLSEVTVYRCESCSYVAKVKGNLTSHMLSHRQLSEVKVYKCHSCSFETKRRGALRVHMLTHRELSKMTAHKCKTCSYLTREKANLKRHMLVHRELSELTAYTCESCPFVTKRQCSLRRHMLTHQELSEAPVFRCESCPFITNQRRYLKKHMLTHRELSEITVYRCESCPYVAREKSKLPEHMLTHREFSEVTVYRCDRCPFKTKYKRNLKGHILTHRELSEIKLK